MKICFPTWMFVSLAGHLGSTWQKDAQQAHLLCVYAMLDVRKAGASADSPDICDVDAASHQHVLQVGC
jgi:hypothetical protein